MVPPGSVQNRVYWMQANRRLLAKVKKRQVNGKVRDFDEEKETWRSILLSSQIHYPIKVLKPWCTQTIHVVECRMIRLTVDKANEIFGTRFLPIIANNDPITGKYEKIWK